MGLSTQNYITGDDFLTFTIWTTSYCNFNCRYCYETENKPSNFMDIETASRVIEYIRAQTVKNNKKTVWITFHGGEPMLNTRVIKYVLDVLEKDEDITYFTSITTNGSVMDDEIFRRINEVSVSLDGQKESHNKNRVNHQNEGTYDLIINNIENILKLRNNNVRLRMVVTPDNTDELFDNIVYVASLGFTEIVPGIDVFSNEWTNEKFRTLYEQLIKLKRYREENWYDKRINIAILDEKVVKKKNCEVGTDGYQIGVNGLLYHCMYTANDPTHSIGNIIDGVDEKKAEEINCLNRIKPDVCEGCTDQPYCEAQRCLILNKLTTGDYYSPSPVLCKYECLKLKLNGVNVEL